MIGSLMFPTLWYTFLVSLSGTKTNLMWILEKANKEKRGVLNDTRHTTVVVVWKMSLKKGMIESLCLSHSLKWIPVLFIMQTKETENSRGKEKDTNRFPWVPSPTSLSLFLSACLWFPGIPSWKCSWVSDPISSRQRQWRSVALILKWVSVLCHVCDADTCRINQSLLFLLSLSLYSSLKTERVGNVPANLSLFKLANRNGSQKSKNQKMTFCVTYVIGERKRREKREKLEKTRTNTVDKTKQKSNKQTNKWIV